MVSFEQAMASPLTAVVVIFFCSLAAAFVSFRYVESKASIEGASGKLFGIPVRGFRTHGAISGFLLSFGLLYGSYFAGLRAQQTPSYTISGQVVTSDGSNELLKATFGQPLIVETGRFELHGVVKDPATNTFPTLYFTCQGFQPAGTEITKETVEFAGNTIKLKDPIELVASENLDLFEDDDLWTIKGDLETEIHADVKNAKLEFSPPVSVVQRTGRFQAFVEQNGDNFPEMLVRCAGYDDHSVEIVPGETVEKKGSRVLELMKPVTLTKSNPSNSTLFADDGE